MKLNSIENKMEIVGERHSSESIQKLKLHEKMELNRKGSKGKMKSAPTSKSTKKMRRKNEKKKLKEKLVNEKLVKKIEPEKRVSPLKPHIFNKDGKLVFSKFDLMNPSDKKSSKSSLTGKNYKQLLEKLKQKRMKIDSLKSTNPEKATQLEEKDVWQTALQRASGIRVKDDPKLLKKSLHLKERKKRKSKSNWKEREKAKDESIQRKAKKRRDNIEKRKKSKKKH